MVNLRIQLLLRLNKASLLCKKVCIYIKIFQSNTSCMYIIRHALFTSASSSNVEYTYAN